MDAWSDAPDFAAQLAAAGTGVTGICGSGIIEVVAELYLAGVITADGVIDGALAARTPRVVADGRTFSYVLHDPADGRRRGDGAPATPSACGSSSPRTTSAPSSSPRPRCMPASGCSWTSSSVEAVDEVRLAGAFGSQIDPLHAMVLGLVPDCDLARVRCGRQRRRDRRAHRAAVGAARREIEAVVRRVEKIETAVEPRFQEHFVEAMAIPHRTAANPNLERAVTLPARPATADRGADPRAERRRRRAATRQRGRAGGMGDDR